MKNEKENEKKVINMLEFSIVQILKASPPFPPIEQLPWPCLFLLNQFFKYFFFPPQEDLIVHLF